MHIDSDPVEPKPVPLNDGERDIVLDLRALFEGNKEFFKQRGLYPTAT